METKYDILVIGSEVPGLVSAVLLAKKGFRVAIVLDDDRPSAYEKNGYLFNESPLIITGLQDGPLGRVFDEIGLPKAAGPKTTVPYQVVLPDERIDVYQEPERFRSELKRCFPGEFKRVFAFYSHIFALNGRIRQVMDLNPFSFRPLLPYGIMRGKLPIDNLMKGLGLSQRFQAFIEAQVAAFSYLCRPISSISASSLLESSRKGIYFLDRGKGGLKELLLKSTKAPSVDIIRSSAKEVSRHGNRWLLRTEEEAISGRTVIGNMDAAAFCGLFLDIRKKYLTKIGKVKRSHYPLTVNLGVKDSGIPAGMPENVVVLRDFQREASGENLFYIQMGPASNGRRSVSITCQVQAERYRKDEVRGISEKMLEGVDWLCPFIDRHVELLDIRYEVQQKDGKYTTTLGQKMGVGVLNNEIIRGEVFFTGPEVFPALGFDGLIYSAEMAAKGVSQGLRIKD